MTWWIVYACIASALIGFTFILVKAGMKKTKATADMAVAVFTTALLIFACVSYGVTGVWKSFLESTWLTRSHLFLLLSSVLFGGSLICIFRAMKTGESQKVTPFYQSHIVVAMFAAMFLLKDKMSLYDIIGGILILVGTAFMVILAYGGHGRVWVGYALLSVVLAVASILIERKYVTGVSDYRIRLVHIFVTFFLSWILVVITGGHRKMRSMPFVDGVLICLAAVCVGLSVYWMNRALAVGGSHNAPYVYVICYLSLVWTVLFACLFLREIISVRESFGLLLIIIGVLILYLL